MSYGSAGWRRLKQKSAQLEAVRLQTLKEQAEALLEAGKSRPTQGPADKARDHPDNLDWQYPKPGDADD
jgi:hypothetical protein